MRQLDINELLLYNSGFSLLLKNIPLGSGLLLLPLFEELGHHRFGAVALVQRPKVFGLQWHFVAFNGQTERQRNSSLI